MDQRKNKRPVPPAAAPEMTPVMPAAEGVQQESSILPPQQTEGMLPVGGLGGALSDIGVDVIGEEALIKANEILNKYRSGKARFDKRVVECEQWWKLRHWQYMQDKGNPEDDKPVSAWLFNCIMSKHADGIEAYPEPNIRPREPGDKEEAKKLSAIVPVVLEQNDYEETYSAVLWQKLKQGTGITAVMWDKDKLNGLGDVALRKIDALNIFWEPGVTDIQRSRNVFTTELVDIELLKEMYPDKLANAPLTGKSFQPAKYIYDDSVDVSDKALVIDWYYHKRQDGRNVLHYVKFVDKYVLYATENDPEWRKRGLYDHGLYPFIFDPLFPIEGSPCGYGYIDVGKNPQASIDRMNQAFEKNVIMGATPRWFISGAGSVNEEEFADWTRPFVHVPNGQLGEESLRQIKVDPMSAIYANMLTAKIEELKETTGNRDASNGGTTAGVTAASAIAAMAEQSGKTSRASTKASYRAYARLINMVIELIRQFYELPRQYRITGNDGQEEYVSYSNAGLQPQHQGIINGQDMGYRLPVFDIDISAQKMTAYTKVAQNEMALQMFQMGVLNPQMADQSLALLDIMDFEGKELIEDKVRQNGTMYQLLVQYQQIALQLAVQSGRGDIAEGLAQTVLGTQQALGAAESVQMANGVNSDAVQGVMPEEHAFVKKARTQAQASTQPGGV